MRGSKEKRSSNAASYSSRGLHATLLNQSMLQASSRKLRLCVILYEYTVYDYILQYSYHGTLYK